MFVDTIFDTNILVFVVSFDFPFNYGGSLFLVSYPYSLIVKSMLHFVNFTIL